LIVTQKRWSGAAICAGSATHLRLRHGGVLGVDGHDAASGEPRGRGASRPERGAQRVASPAERRPGDRRANPRVVVARRGKVPATGGGRDALRGRRHADVRVDEAKRGSTERGVQKAGADETTYVAARAGRCVRAFHGDDRERDSRERALSALFPKSSHDILRRANNSSIQGLKSVGGTPCSVSRTFRDFLFDGWDFGLPRALARQRKKALLFVALFGGWMDPCSLYRSRCPRRRSPPARAPALPP